MSGRGFKILLDIFMSAEAPVRFAEIPYRMRSREHGSSKLDVNVAWEFFALVVDKLIGHIVPLRFIMFVTVGAFGAVLHLTVLGMLTQVLQYAFVIGQTVATVVAMTANFYFNNLFTYRDRRLRGWSALRGLASFYVVCGLGAAINVVLAGFLFDAGIVWWLSGLIGALVGSVWNYAVSSALTWKSEVDPPKPVVESGEAAAQRSAVPR
jgi:dolichol-phosphate mannosyltransferase